MCLNHCSHFSDSTSPQITFETSRVPWLSAFINMASSSTAKPQNGFAMQEQALAGAKNEVNYELEDDFAYGTSVATSSPAVRLGFIRRVYGILAAQLLLTSIICALFMFISPLRQIAVGNAGMLTVVSFIGTLACLFALIAKKDSYPLNMQLLMGFTVFESLLLGSVCGRYAASGLSSLVLEALVITMAIFGGITIYAFVSKRDFSFMGGALFAALLALMACSFINLLLGISGNQSPALAFLISWGGSVLFSLYILFDSKLWHLTYLFHYLFVTSRCSISFELTHFETNTLTPIFLSCSLPISVNDHSPSWPRWCHPRCGQFVPWHPQLVPPHFGHFI